MGVNTYSRGIGDIMTAKEYLKSYRKAMLQIKCKKAQIERLRADLLPRGISYTGMPKGSDIVTMADTFARLDDMERKALAEIEAAQKQADDVLATINSVSRDDYKLILMDRYVLNMGGDDVAQDVGYVKRHVYRMHGSALDKVDRILEHAQRKCG